MEFYTMNETQKEFLTIGETQATLGCCRAFVYKLIAKNELTPYKVGRRAYIKASELNKLFKPRN
ncbi:MAG: helix-turn-helix domain-containing protein [Cyclobacteriaceae bacterium]|nr:helix-turn-helix domain-containing protein [Cyclobacteriaceae bacterium]